MTEYRCFNRELSWINYNNRILEEGLRQDLPPLERFRFFSIVSSNWDEFFMVRVAALKRALSADGTAGATEKDSEEVLTAAADMIRSMLARLYRCLAGEIFPALAAGGLELRRPPFTAEESSYLKPLFMREILSTLTPLRFGSPGEDPPSTEAGEPGIANGILYGAFLLKKTENPDPGLFISIVEIPPIMDRFIRIESSPGRLRWALLDDLLMLWGDAFFPGYEVQERMLFRIHRDADFSVDERRDEDFVEAMEEVLVNRRRSPAVRMLHSPGSRIITETLARRLGLGTRDLFSVEGPLNLSSLGTLGLVPGFDQLKCKPHKPCPHPAFSGDTSVWEVIRKGDVLLTLPYQSFDPVIRFFQEAAADPLVISIKATLYRTSGNSPVVWALEQAALQGKHVTAVVELKARFDEERNISWANRLEKAGVIVIYGLARLKVHAKISQVIRREADGLIRYIHLSTGNYNDKTARFYSDLSLFTCREDFGSDATFFFNMLSGYSVLDSMRRLVMAPRRLKQRFIELIDREAKRASQGSPGRIIAKMNALVDDDVAAALYRASQAGVKINLNIRGICTLVPGAPGLSENIRVISIVDRFLEHSRIFYFNNGGAEEFYISSADWMPRNLERRVELLIPMLDGGVQEELRRILDAYFTDNTQAWVLKEDGGWNRRNPQGDEKPFRAQEHLQKLAEKAAEQPWKTKQAFIIRRSLPPGT
ncbi:MAG: polyphosphate kinase 1 [Spirochaetaceae bacterium]|jgi:polyphosphate kinase|nr:polyphosphate kinase 1 [Spirochaetaceae bacterium]